MIMKHFITKTAFFGLVLAPVIGAAITGSALLHNLSIFTLVLAYGWMILGILVQMGRFAALQEGTGTPEMLGLIQRQSDRLKISPVFEITTISYSLLFLATLAAFGWVVNAVIMLCIVFTAWGGYFGVIQQYRDSYDLDKVLEEEVPETPKEVIEEVPATEVAEEPQAVS